MRRPATTESTRSRPYRSAPRKITALSGPASSRTIWSPRWPGFCLVTEQSGWKARTHRLVDLLFERPSSPNDRPEYRGTREHALRLRRGQYAINRISSREYSCPG
jgi:hypothetical protein